MMIPDFQKGFLQSLLCIGGFLLSIPTLLADSFDYAASPNQGTTSAPPQVMLVMPVDQQLFKRAYSDYTDIDGDGLIDTTYNDSFEYYGYFDSDFCYEYHSSPYFTPVSKGTGPNGHHCISSGAPWSGNFMNWLTMSRMDLLRAILFGGTRSIDTTNNTVLSKADSSTTLSGSWAKVYDGSDIGKYTPYDSTTSFCNLKYNNYPTLRITSGNYPRWATTESNQCRLYGAPGAPPVGKSFSNLRIHVQVCVAGVDANNSERCKKYPDGNFKPVGILQRYGEKNQTHFGLISGSNSGNNDSGGLLRKNTGSITDELNLDNGIFDSSAKGIIHHISKFGLTWWNNPIAELYLEAVRYFSGNTSPSSAFSANDSSHGLATESWTPPLDTTNACASCAIILISSGTNNRDRDDLNSSADITGLTAAGGLSSQTDRVGNQEYEGSFAGSYFHGNDSSSCKLNHLSRLSNANGICPGAPGGRGGYDVAGLSYHAWTTDLRTDLDGYQNVKTYSIQLAEDLPSLVVDVAGKQVSFLPLSSAGYYRDLVVNFQAADGKAGDYTFIWEDCSSGCDNDFDAASRIRYCHGSGCTPAISESEIMIEHRFDSKVTYTSYSFSYNIYGTDNDGVAPYASGPGGGIAQDEGPWHSETYTVTGAPSGILPNPLYLAAKYGSFTDLDNDGTPNYDANGNGAISNDTREWDVRNNSLNSAGPDGIPDNFFLANNPSLLQNQLDLILIDISNRISSGASAEFAANDASGTGSAIQGLFRAEVTINNIEINWVGLLHSLFVDSNGYLREDSNGNRTLDGYHTDKAVRLFFNPTTKQTLIQRYKSPDNGITLSPDGITVDLTELNPVWDAREQLMSVSDVITQRTYSTPANNGRHILTWLDNNHNNEVDSGEQQAFTTSAFYGGYEGYLDVPSSEVDKLVRFLRGEDQPGYRSRSVDYDNDGDLEVWRLGDIIHSNPVSVAEPKGFYTDNRPFNVNDSTFINFKNHYKDRRQVVYVGSNDGMIHAFNAGFWDDENNRFNLSKNGATAHPLGSELWAYAPMNLLPHLRYLSEPDYPHVYYMDGEPLIFDANIFPPDSDHPDGWGTVLVMGMRLGGGPVDTTVNGTARTMRSAYVMLDITNPEKPPVLMDEITHSKLGFTTNRPVVVQRRKPGIYGDYTVPTENNWYLAFGSGPIGSGLTGTRNALDNATSSEGLRVFIYDMRSKNLVSPFAPKHSGIYSAYAGNMTVVDWDNDYYDDNIYFGSVRTGGSSLDGDLMRIVLKDGTPANWTLSRLLKDVGRPIIARPKTISDNYGKNWVFIGTGRELTQDDSLSTEQEFFAGVRAYDSSLVSFNSLVDTTDIQVQANGNLTSTFTVRPGTNVNNFSSLLNAMKTEKGWVNKLSHDGTGPSGKSISPATNSLALLLFAEYQPPTNQCQVEGSSFLHALHYQTGTAIPANIQKVLINSNITDSEISLKKIALGYGLGLAPEVYQGKDGKTSVIIQGSAGSISNISLDYTFKGEGRQSWRHIRKIPR